MDEKRYRLAAAAGLILPAEHAETLLALRDGDAALIYIWLLTSGDALREEHCARQLGLSVSAVHAAAEKLRSVGLLGEAAEKKAPLPPPEETPPYTAEDIVRRSREDSTFQALVLEAQQVLGHSLSTADLKTLFGIYDRLGMPVDVIMLLFHHCAEKIRKRYGEGRLPTMRTVEKEAYHWANREVLTMEQAEEYLSALSRREQESYRVREALGVQHRDLTPTEQKYLDGWLEMGYSTDALAIAYDRTMVSTGKLAWAYMNKIVLDWYNKGLFTPEEIEKGDGRGRKKPAAAPAHSGTRPAGGDDLDRAERLLNNTKR